jgi:hypothetical protein
LTAAEMASTCLAIHTKNLNLLEGMRRTKYSARDKL